MQNSIPNSCRVSSSLFANYVDEPDPSKLYQGAIKGMMDSLDDPYSTFLDEDMMSDLMSDTTGTYGGVGLYISKQATTSTEDTPRYIEVVSPIEDTPAWKEGIRPGDLIIKIDGEDTAPLSTDKASAKSKASLERPWCSPLGAEITSSK